MISCSQPRLLASVLFIHSAIYHCQHSSTITTTIHSRLTLIPLVMQAFGNRTSRAWIAEKNKQFSRRRMFASVANGDWMPKKNRLNKYLCYSSDYIYWSFDSSVAASLGTGSRTNTNCYNSFLRVTQLARWHKEHSIPSKSTPKIEICLHFLLQ